MAKTTTFKKTTRKNTVRNNTKQYDYQHFWRGREYEHQAEVIAIRKFLQGKHFKSAVDVGGGYGRLCVLLREYADTVTLAEPSRKQLNFAAQFSSANPEILRKRMKASNLQFDDNSVDLLIMIRVAHYLPDPTAEFDEISRVLNQQGCAIIEVANYLHMQNRIRQLVKRQRIPVKPITVSSQDDEAADDLPFVKHNPYTILRQLDHAGLQVDAMLSVSNLRSVRLKRILPHKMMIVAERAMQKPLSGVYFGPSIFYLVHKGSSV